MTDDLERLDHHFFLAAHRAVAFEITPRCLQSPAASYGFFGGKIS
jgi:hypothetical protein